MRRPLSLLLLPVLASIAGVLPVAAVSASLGRIHRPIAGTAPPDAVQSWAVTPVSDSDSTGAVRSTFSYALEPGSEQDDAVVIYNLGNVQMTFRVYATDAFTTAAGDFSALPGDQEPSDVGSWVQLAQELVTVAPGKQVTIPFTLEVPADADPGDHAGAILASVYTGEQPNPDDEVVIDRRTGTRLYLRVGGEVRAEFAVGAVEATYDQNFPDPFSGAVDLTYRVENRGNVRSSAAASLTLSGPFGMGERTVSLPELPELLPGEQITVSTRVADVPAWFLANATVSLRPIDPADPSAFEPTSSSDAAFAPPLLPLVGALVIILLVLALRAVRRQARAGVRVPEETRAA